jgi:hypothetical protein
LYSQRLPQRSAIAREVAKGDIASHLNSALAKVTDACGQDLSGEHSRNQITSRVVDDAVEYTVRIMKHTQEMEDYAAMHLRTWRSVLSKGKMLLAVLKQIKALQGCSHMHLIDLMLNSGHL